MFYIYKITNIINGKVYIGQTNNLKRRWYKHKFDSKSDEPKLIISKAIKKYGIENFKYEEIDCCNSLEECNKQEVWYIFIYRSLTSQFGYNIEEGGNKSKMSDETKEKLRAANLGKKHSDETLKKMKEIHTGKFHSEETKEKCRLLKMGKLASEETKAKLSKIQSKRPRGKRTDETKERMRQARLGKKVTPETLKKMSECNRKITDDQIKLILEDNRKHYIIAKDIGCSPSRIGQIKMKYRNT